MKPISDESEAPKGCISSTVGPTVRVFASVKEHIKVEAEIARLSKKLSETEGFLQKTEKKMQAKGYEKVPADVRKEDAEKLEKYQTELTILHKSMETMKGFL